MNINEQLKTIGWTPLHTRLLAHRIGDGSVNYYGHYDWSNKHMEEFVELAKFLKVKSWGPIISDKYGTKKIIVHKKNFKNFAAIFGLNHEHLIHDKLLLLDTLKQLPKDHKIQMLLAFIVDDGSCSNWMLSLFVDPDEQVIEKVKILWNDVFPGTLSIQTSITKKGTKVYRLFCNREGIISLMHEIREAVRKYGPIANLWWKQPIFDNRYKKAISKRAKELYETKIYFGFKEKRVLEYLKENKTITIKEIRRILNLTKDRAHRFITKLVKNNKLFLIDAGNRARYSLEYEDNSFENRKKIIMEYLMKNRIMRNRDCRRLLDVGSSKAYKILKEIQKQGNIKQIKSNGTTYYVPS
ncbi:winged helix-turn-helix transcriptional regulator [Candidatus Woesearchaeota archaeon]|nr:winged helix-turn-helix transcriptional regulator [Candidatus Woesearchaeota archaeon]